jgi:hypothetical protein
MSTTKFIPTFSFLLFNVIGLDPVAYAPIVCELREDIVGLPIS